MIPIPVDYNWVKAELWRLDRAFQIARDVYSSPFPDFKHGYDARITVYSKCASFISSATLGAQFMLDSLSRDEWWEKTEPWATLQRQPNYKRGIPPREYDLFLRLGLVVGIFSSIESTFRDYFEALPNMKSKSTEDIRSIRDKIFAELKIDEEHTKLMKILGLVRNSLHNNGVHRPDWTDQPIIINYKGQDHIF